jgi:hypothetical protein
LLTSHAVRSTPSAALGGWPAPTAVRTPSTFRWPSNLVWISAAKPGRSSEITTARHNRIPTRLREAGLGALADLVFVGLDDDPDDPVIVTGRRAPRGHPLTDAQKEANRLVSRERAANEHGFAD